MGAAIHLVIAFAAVLAVLEFAPAIVHASTDVERWRLVAGAIVFGTVANGLAVHRADPLTYRVWLIFVAELVWLVSAYKARKRRRSGTPT